MYYSNYQPKQRWQSAHIYVKELLKSYKILSEFSLTIEDLYDIFSVGQVQAIRALRVAYSFPPVSREGEYDIEILESCMEFRLFEILQAILNYEYKHQYYSGYASCVILNGIKINTSEIEVNSSFYFEIKNECLKVLSSYINLLEEVFFQLYLEESYDELSYYSPYEKLTYDDDIIDHVIQSGVCKNKDEVLSIFGKMNDNGTIELEVNFFDKKYSQFQDYEKKLIAKYAREDHISYFYSEVNELDELLQKKD